MSEETLRRFIERLKVDSTFRESVEKDPLSAFGEFELSPAERVALASGDEDALRRLTGADVSPFAAPAGHILWETWLCNVYTLNNADECAYVTLEFHRCYPAARQ